MVTEEAGVPGLGRAVRKLRIAAELSQERLARMADLTMSVVAKLEQGHTDEVKLSSAIALAKALGVSLDDLVREAERAAAEDVEEEPRKSGRPKKGGGR